MVKYFHFHIPELDIWFDKPLESNQCLEIKPDGHRCAKRVVIGAPYCAIHMKYKHYLAIEESEIPGAGKGVFVFDIHKEEDEVVFKKGDRICYYDGEVLTHEQFKQRYKTLDHDKTTPYVVELNKGKFEDAAIKRGIGSMINHKPSRECNCKLSITKNNRAQILAIKNIKNYEELYINYGRSYRFNEEGVETSTNSRKYNA
jgi:SET domain-containing protein